VPVVVLLLEEQAAIAAASNAAPRGGARVERCMVALSERME
jgi:hypothetical protein